MANDDAIVTQVPTVDKVTRNLDHHKQQHESSYSKEHMMQKRKDGSSSRSKSRDRKYKSPDESKDQRRDGSRRYHISYSHDDDDDKKLSRRHYRRSSSKNRTRSSRHTSRRGSSSSPSTDRYGVKKSKRSRRSHSRNEKPRTQRSRSRSKERSPPRKESISSRESSIPRRKRRTGWDAAPARTDGLGASNFLPSALTPTSTGFTASLAGRTPEEAASMAASLQLKATASQLCRIYVGSLDYSLTDQDIRQVFSAFGQITSIDMPKEGTRSKGFCFIEYATPDSAEMALSTMPGFNLKGRAIKVGRPTALGGQAVTTLPLTSVARVGGVNAAEAGQIAAAMLLARTEGQALGLSTMDDAQNRVYVGNIPPNFTADDIKQIFQCFGKILSCQLIPNSEKPGTHRGYGFIEFGTYDAAKSAIDSMNNFQIAGKSLKVNHATVMRGLNNTGVPPGAATTFSAPLPTNTNTMTAALGALASSATGANAVPVQQLLQATSPNPLVAAVNPTFAAGLSNPIAVPVMSDPTAMAQTMQYQTSSAPSSILLLSDMVDISEANDDLKEEIRQECSRYGNINDITIAFDAQKNSVRIFVVFSDPKDAAGAMPMLHDRWFGGRRIQARLYNENLYSAGSLWL